MSELPWLEREWSGLYTNENEFIFHLKTREGERVSSPYPLLYFSFLFLAFPFPSFLSPLSSIFLSLLPVLSSLFLSASLSCLCFTPRWLFMVSLMFLLNWFCFVTCFVCLFYCLFFLVCLCFFSVFLIMFCFFEFFLLPFCYHDLFYSSRWFVSFFFSIIYLSSFFFLLLYFELDSSSSFSVWLRATGLG